MRIYLKAIHVSYRDQTLENERIKSENSQLKGRNKFLEEELVHMHQVQKERDDAVFLEQELREKYKQLELVLEREQNILKTWTNSGKDTNEVFQTDKVGLGYSEEDNLRFENTVKVKTPFPLRTSLSTTKSPLPTTKFVSEKGNSRTNTVEEDVKKEAVKVESVKPSVKQVNIGSMTDKQLKHKLKEVKSVKKQKVSRKNRNGKVGITARTMLASYSPRKECYNCGSTKHLASACTKNKNINSLPSKSGVKKEYVRTRPQTLCKHCGSTWHSIYTCRKYHAVYHNDYDLKPNLKWVRVNSANSDNVSLNSDEKNSAAKADKFKKAKGSKQVWILKTKPQ
jgi:hypothetical protein